jgi:hypothetical protein
VDNLVAACAALGTVESLGKTQKVTRRNWLGKVASALLGVQGRTTVIPETDGGFRLAPYGVLRTTEALRLTHLFRLLHLSVRQLNLLPRSCHRRDLTKTRADHTPYRGFGGIISPPIGARRAFACANLVEVVRAAVKVAQAERGPDVLLRGSVSPVGQVFVVIAVDATQLWSVAATRCDVLVDVWGGLQAAAKPRNWSTWFIAHGGDDSTALRHLNIEAKLDEQVAELLSPATRLGLDHVPACLRTGDGKGMVAANFRPQKRCWLGECDIHADLLPRDDIVADVSEYGAFCGVHIGPLNCPGDYVHAACRCVNMLFKRSLTWFGDLGTPVGKAAVARIKDLLYHIRQEGLKVPRMDRTAPRPSKANEVDIDGALLFLRSPELGARLFGIARTHAEGLMVSVLGVWWPVWQVVAQVVQALCRMFAVWGQKTLATPQQLEAYLVNATRMGTGWLALGWRGTLWIHWATAHSHHLLKTWRTLYFFSSIPTERRHAPFKMDLRHCFHGWKLSRPAFSVRGLLCALHLDALDVGLRLNRAVVRAAGGQQPRNRSKR